MVSMFIGPLVVPLDLWQPTGLDPAYFHTCDSDAPLVDNADAVTAPLPYILLWMLWHWDMSPPAQKGGASTVSTAGKPPLQYPILACEFWKRTSISDYTHNIYIYIRLYSTIYIYTGKVFSEIFVLLPRLGIWSNLTRIHLLGNWACVLFSLFASRSKRVTQTGLELAKGLQGKRRRWSWIQDHDTILKPQTWEICLSPKAISDTFCRLQCQDPKTTDLDGSDQMALGNSLHMSEIRSC